MLPMERAASVTEASPGRWRSSHRSAIGFARLSFAGAAAADRHEPRGRLHFLRRNDRSPAPQHRLRRGANEVRSA